jgi:hypothetical protein
MLNLIKYYTITTKDNQHIYTTKDREKIDHFLKILMNRFSYLRDDILVSSIYEEIN